jgi:hypothetical protein
MNFKSRYRRGAGPPLPAQGASATYIQLARDALLAEDARKISLEQRGSWIATASTGLTGVLFVLAEFVHKIGKVHYSDPAAFSMAASISLFVMAAGLGVACGWPQAYRQITTNELKRFGESVFWDAPSKAAEKRIFEATVEALEISRRKNEFKARILIAAMCAQVFAIGIWAVAVCIVLV